MIRPGRRSPGQLRQEGTVSIEVVDLTDGETITVGPLTLRILEDGSHTEHRLGLVEVTIPPHVDGPPQHIHREHDETFLVVSGTPRFTSGDDHVDALPGMLVTVPVDTPHTFSNPGDTTVVMVGSVSPDLYIGYFRELGELPQGVPDPRAIAEIMSRYATEVVPLRGDARLR
jgi:mannose-6-phosphate isomerase-like protein (cupin superfamily)